jgi:hypothetical protein
VSRKSKPDGKAGQLAVCGCVELCTCRPRRRGPGPRRVCEQTHPYEEAQGFQRLLDIPGYDVAALVEKSGKSASHIYARLSLLQLIPAVAEAFTEGRTSRTRDAACTLS